MDVTKPFKFIGLGAMDDTKPFACIGFAAMDATKRCKFIGFGAMDATKPYKFIGFGNKSIPTKRQKLKTERDGQNGWDYSVSARTSVVHVFSAPKLEPYVMQ